MSKYDLKIYETPVVGGRAGTPSSSPTRMSLNADNVDGAKRAARDALRRRKILSLTYASNRSLVAYVEKVQ